MSVKWTWQQAILESELPSTVKLVLLALGCYMNMVGEGCYPSTKRLAAETSLSERAVCTAVAKAQAAGWLKVKLMGFKGQKWKRNSYFPSWPQGLKEGTEPRSAANPKALNVATEGTERHDKKALNHVQSNLSVNLPVEKDAQARATEGAALARRQKPSDEMVEASKLGDLVKMLTKGNA